MTQKSDTTGGGTPKRKGKSSAAKKSSDKKHAPGGRVAVVGGGLAGLSAAMRLTRAEFDVTLFEARPTVGGNTSSTRKNKIDHDVYPHMFCDWYENFWDLFENDMEMGAHEKHFDRRDGVKMLRKGETKYTDLLNATSIDSVIANLKSGALSIPEIFLLGFSALDLAAHPFNRTGTNQLGKLDVNGFLYSRGYATQEVAEMENYILTLIWSIQSERTAAATYQNFLRHGFKFPDDSPFSWLLKGSLRKNLLDPLKKKLEEYGCEVQCGAKVSAVRVVDGRPHIWWEKPKGKTQTDSFDYIVLAVPAEPLSKLVMHRDENLPGKRLVSLENSLSDLRRLSSVPIPVVDLYLKRTVPDFPKEHIGLADSKYGLTVVDISQLWTGEDFGGKTALVVAASDGTSIPAEEPEEQGWLMLKEFQQFYPKIEIGTHWGDAGARDIDWDKTHVRSNDDYKLLLNDVGSWAWRPRTHYPKNLPRVFFAGDLCQNDVDMATVETAVQSGFQAALVVQKQDEQIHGKRRGDPITLEAHTAYGTASFRAAKLALLPVAYGALGWAAFEQWKKRKEDGDAPLGRDEWTLAEYMLLVPMQYSIDWWKAAYWFGRSLTFGGEDDPLGGLILYNMQNRQSGEPPDCNTVGGRTVLPEDAGDHIIGLGSATLAVLGECARYAADRWGKPSEPKSDPLEAGLSAAGSLLGEAAKIGESLIEALQRADPGSKPYVRRWRVKR